MVGYSFAPIFLVYVSAPFCLWIRRNCGVIFGNKLLDIDYTLSLFMGSMELIFDLGHCFGISVME